MQVLRNLISDKQVAVGETETSMRAQQLASHLKRGAQVHGGCSPSANQGVVKRSDLGLSWISTSAMLSGPRKSKQTRASGPAAPSRLFVYRVMHSELTSSHSAFAICCSSPVHKHGDRHCIIESARLVCCSFTSLSCAATTC